MATRVTSARFVGRAAELAELESALRGAAEGHPSLAFVAGDSGVGKSRLVEELSHRARAFGARALWGDCVDLGEGELPYAPLLGALRQVVRDGDRALEELPPALLGDLGTILPGLAAEASEAQVPQSRVFEALLELLEAIGEVTPLVLVIEDLHWADDSTRHFIRFLSRTICSERLLLVATYRSDELHRRHPVRPLVADLTRDPTNRLIELPTFTREEMQEQLEDILAEPPEQELLDRLYARSEGNALFTEELLAAGLDGRGTLPPTLRDALMLRVDQLPAESQEVLRWLSCQPAMGHGLLAAASGLDPVGLREPLREAVASHIIVALPDGRYAFRHALLREVVRDDLLPGERMQMHAALAEALERKIEEGHKGAHLTAEIAHHWMSAGDQPRAFAASVRAATAAERVHAFGEALTLLERALALWGRVDNPEEAAGCEHWQLLARAAHAADMSGDAVRQEALLKRALELVDEHDDPRRAATLLERLQRAQWNSNRQDESIETIDRALALLPEGEQSSERAALLAARAKSRMLQARFNEAAATARDALEVARAVGDASVEARALNALGVSLGRGYDDTGIEVLKEAVEVARRSGAPDDVATAYVNISDLYNISGRTREAVEAVRAGLEEFRGVTRAADWLSLNLAEFLYDAGDWEEAEAALPAAGRRLVGTTLMNWRLMRARLLLGRGDCDGARHELDLVARPGRASTEPQFVGTYYALRADLERRCGDIDAARAAIDEGLDRIEFCSDDYVRITALATRGMRVEGDAGQLARDRRDPAAERVARERADALFERVQLASQPGGPIEAAELATAEAERARAHGPDDPALWAGAADMWDAVGRPYPAAITRWRQAEALVSAEARDEAATVAEDAIERARRLGSEWLAEEVESLVTRARLRLSAGAPEAGEEPAVEEEDPFGLTTRERQVLSLVARGATNREIGLELHMAEKTASVHVSRILGKLGVRSRTEAAAVAHRLGMADTGAPA
jgi:ATP/maltotriose-dependent transcriptional regulator MalT